MFHMGHAMLNLVTEDITRQAVDLVVNPSNNYLWMKEGVAGALKHAGGQVVEREAMRKGPIPVGSVVMTNSGELPCKRIAHAVIMAQDLRTDSKIITETVRNVLEEAEKTKASTVAFPAMGLGVGRLNPQTSAAAMFRPMLEILPDSEVIKEIRLCFLDEDIREIFHDALLDIFSSAGA